MAVSNIQADSLVKNPIFGARIQVAMVKTALAVLGENNSGLSLPEGSQYSQKRTALASKILNSPRLKQHENALIPIFGYAVVSLAAAALDPNQENITDNYLEVQVTNVFNDIAGITFEEMPA